MRLGPQSHHHQQMVLTSRLIAISTALGLLPCCAGCTKRDSTGQPARNRATKALIQTQKSTNNMSTERLISLVKQGSMEANALAADLGRPAAPVLARLASDPNPQVRLTALVCLETVGGDHAIQTALAHIEDTDEQVASEALIILLHDPPQGQEKLLLAAFDRGKYAATRLQIPLIAGRLAPKVDPEPWRKRYAVEQAVDVKENLLVALARMGDAGARAEFARQLKAARGPETPRWIEHAEYVDQPWVAPALLALLDRRDHAVDLAPDFKNRLPQRVCDLAARALVEITHAKVGFPVRRVQPFTDDELRAIRRAVSP